MTFEDNTLKEDNCYLITKRDWELLKQELQEQGFLNLIEKIK